MTIPNHRKCKFCDKVLPEGLYGAMWDHTVDKHQAEAVKLVKKIWFEVAWVPPSKSKNGEEWIRVKS